MSARQVTEFDLPLTPLMSGVHCYGRVFENQIAQGKACTIARTSRGVYVVAFDTPAPRPYTVLKALETAPGRDDYMVTYETTEPEGFIVTVTEQDNGGIAGRPRDGGFSFAVLVL